MSDLILNPDEMCARLRCAAPLHGPTTCGHHYPRNLPPVPIAVSFWRKVRLGGREECWEWLAARNEKDYGIFRRGIYAHRFAYEARIGAIPDGLTGDHLCLNKGCANPDRIEIVTRGENGRRG